jgi:hypothetical protein
MFDLEQALAEWRRQMLAAGITTPAPLEELEIHLHEEIEQGIASGLNEADAFQAAVEKIGQAGLLQKEFKKVEKGRKIIRAILLAMGWLAAGCTLAYSVANLDFGWNFYSFAPGWGRGVFVSLLGILASDGAIWFLAKANQGKTSRAVSLFVCLFLNGLAVLWFHVDESAHGVLLCVPSVFWVGWTRYHLSQRRGPPQGNQQIHSA